VGRTDEESKQEQVWKLLSEAGLIDISPNEFPDRIKQAKDVVIERLNELLKVTNQVQERESAAYSLAILRRLQTSLTRLSQSQDPDRSR
jgi:hypothetical protein